MSFDVYQDVRTAVATEVVLMVPVVRDAHRMSLAEIESSIAEYAGQARDGTIKLEDLQGGTFTITNGGVVGSRISTPLLNMPQSAMLGMHSIKESTVAENGENVIRCTKDMALFFDKRMPDG